MRKIVVGIDGSDTSREALRWAVDEARAHSARVVALHAYDLEIPTTDLVPTAPVDIPGLVTETHEGVLRAVTALVEEVAGDDSIVEASAVEAENPAEALIEAARDADLLVVGSHGVGLTELVLGSVSLECVQHAPCPVLVHRRPS